MAASEYGTVEEMKKKIAQNIYKTEAKDSTKNPLWQSFRSIFATDDEGKKISIPFVSCVKCDTVLTCSAKSGTSHLRRHADGCSSGISGTASVANYFKSSTKAVPKAAKDYFNREVHRFRLQGHTSNKHSKWRRFPGTCAGPHQCRSQVWASQCQ